MGLSLLEFEKEVKAILDQRVTKTAADYESVLTKAASAVQSGGGYAGFLVRVNSTNNNVEVYDRVHCEGGFLSAHNMMASSVGGLPLLDAPGGVIKSTLGGGGSDEQSLVAAMQASQMTLTHGSLPRGTTAKASSILTSHYRTVKSASSAMSVKTRVWDDHKNLIELPELTIKPADLQLVVRYISAMSNMPAFAKLYSELGAVEESRDPDVTLYVAPISPTRRIMRYSSKFLAKAIVQDMLAHKVGLPGTEKYAGALASVAYAIGHELLHVLYNHWDKDVKQGLRDIQMPPLLNKTNSKLLQRLMKDLVPIEELMNNRFMSQMLDMPAINGGYTVPEFRSTSERFDADAHRRITGGRWYLATEAVFGEGTSVTNYLSKAVSPRTSAEDKIISEGVLATLAQKLNYDTWYPVIFSFPTSGSMEGGAFQLMPNERTFFTDSTLPLPTFRDLDLLMRKALGATRKDEELVMKAPTYAAELRKPKVVMHDAADDAGADDATAGGASPQAGDAQAQQGQSDSGQGQDQGSSGQGGSQANDQNAQQKPQNPPVAVGDVVKDKTLGVYSVVISVVRDGDPQQIVTYPVNRLPSGLIDKIDRAVKGNLDDGILDAALIASTQAMVNVGGAPYAPVRLSDDTMATVAASMAEDYVYKPSVVAADTMRPVYVDVRDEVVVDPNQKSDQGSNEPQPDIEINNTPDMPQDDQGSDGGGGGATKEDPFDSEEPKAKPPKQDPEDDFYNGDSEDDDSGDDSGSGSGSGSGAGDDSDGDDSGDSGDGADADADDGGSDDSGSGSGSGAGDDSDGDDSGLDDSGSDSGSSGTGSDASGDDAGDGDSGDDSGDDPASGDASSGSSSGGAGSDGGGDEETDKDRLDRAKSGAGAQDDENSQEAWDDFLSSLGSDPSSTTLGNHESEKQGDGDATGSGSGDDTAGDDTAGDDAGSAGDGEGDSDDSASDGTGAGSDADAGDADDAGKGPDKDVDTGDLFNRDPDSPEAMMDRVQKQQALNDMLNRMNDALKDAADVMDGNRKERDKNGGVLDQDSIRRQTTSGSGIAFSGAQRADAETQQLMTLIAKWGRTLRGVAVDTEVGYNPSKLSRRIKGAWGADDDIEVESNTDDKALLVIIDTSASLTSYATIITKAIASTAYALQKKMGVKYVLPVNFDGYSRPSNLFTIPELKSGLGPILAGGGSDPLSAYRYAASLLADDPHVLRAKSKYKGKLKNVKIGGVLMLTDFDLLGSGRGRPMPEELVTALRAKPGSGRIPWLNVCWLVNGGRSIMDYNERFYVPNAKRWGRLFRFDAIASTKDGTASMIPQLKVEPDPS